MTTHVNDPKVTVVVEGAGNTASGAGGNAKPQPGRRVPRAALAQGLRRPAAGGTAKPQPRRRPTPRAQALQNRRTGTR